MFFPHSHKKESDLVTRVVPSLRLELRGDRGHLSTQYKMLRKIYADYSDMDSTHQFFTTNARRDVTARFFVLGAGSLGLFDDVDEVDDGTDILIGSRVSYKTYAGQGGFGYRLTKQTTATFTGTASKRENDDEPQSTRFDQETWGFQGSLQHAWSPTMQTGRPSSYWLRV